MSKTLLILDDVAECDLPSILTYHLPRSRGKAEAILAAYDRLVVMLETSLFAIHSRSHGWRVCIFALAPTHSSVESSTNTGSSPAYPTSAAIPIEFKPDS